MSDLNLSLESSLGLAWRDNICWYSVVVVVVVVDPKLLK
jgi:hypothetical protein